MLKILFLCTHNRCRSIMAEAIANSFNDDRLNAVSAGSQPAGEVHPLTLRYLKKHNIETDNLRSESWDKYSNYDPDVAITLCDSAASEPCPTWLDGTGNILRIHWGVRDPSSNPDSKDATEQAFNHTIDLIKTRLKMLLSEIDMIDDKTQLNDTLKHIALSITDEPSIADQPRELTA